MNALKLRNLIKRAEYPDMLHRVWLPTEFQREDRDAVDAALSELGYERRGARYIRTEQKR